MARFRAEDRLDRAFAVAVVLKGLDGVLELFGGVLLLFLDPVAVNQMVAAVTRHELSEDPQDLVANYLLGTAHGLTGRTVLFAAAYLVSHGLVKIVLVVALLRDRLWAYPWMIFFLVVFIGYQLYRIALAPTAGLVAVTVFDVVVVLLTYREYRKRSH